jgi:large subunit ribosomal protein L25
VTWRKWRKAMEQPVLNAQIRGSRGKGIARQLRMNKEIPAVFYGPATKPVMLTVKRPDLEAILKRASGENVIFDLRVYDGTTTQSRTAMLKELQVHPIRDVYLHADFYEISLDKEITVDIPIHLLNTPIGVTNGGVLEQLKRELSVTCLPGKLIDALEVDVAHLELGGSLHVRDIPLPEGIETSEDEELAIAVIATPRAEKERPVEEGEVAAAEPEAEEPEAS